MLFHHRMTADQSVLLLFSLRSRSITFQENERKTKGATKMENFATWKTFNQPMFERRRSSRSTARCVLHIRGFSLRQETTLDIAPS
ncbi:hypothetical protein IW261DRAFT_1514044 [Armillaria novae-zelandiae]|uniref:Uncharacterized protein n=1 Tax=Armillaria novae-zelandiae TaxID=153914 RepID=A0AA39NSH1_9AGAR|nr:hypothetical protein IW261DRAFT_1514044 [Armillaria novae-zelandiae]